LAVFTDLVLLWERVLARWLFLSNSEGRARFFYFNYSQEGRKEGRKRKEQKTMKKQKEIKRKRKGTAERQWEYDDNLNTNSINE
jgi:hypothetical protein